MIDKDGSYHTGIHTSRGPMGYVKVIRHKNKKNGYELHRLYDVVKWMAIPR
jgi:hypothetical protein